MIVQGWAVIMMAIYFKTVINACIDKDEAKYYYVGGVLLHLPVYGRVFGWW